MRTSLSAPRDHLAKSSAAMSTDIFSKDKRPDIRQEEERLPSNQTNKVVYAKPALSDKTDSAGLLMHSSAVPADCQRGS